ncbi:hypothetical protein VPH35_096218 [Triticum aestivum]|uniref:Uncharacterized protein n=1 Tax=Aegilops tauschii subsp. strangulata TaxID=200361 RepID=A0A453JX48_AEGTS
MKTMGEITSLYSAPKQKQIWGIHVAVCCNLLPFQRQASAVTSPAFAFILLNRDSVIYVYIHVVKAILKIGKILLPTSCFLIYYRNMNTSCIFIFMLSSCGLTKGRNSHKVISLHY